MPKRKVSKKAKEAFEKVDKPFKSEAKRVAAYREVLLPAPPKRKEKVIKAWAVYVDGIGIEWSDGNECLAIYKKKINAKKRAMQADGVYEVVPVTLHYKK